MTIQTKFWWDCYLSFSVHLHTAFLIRVSQPCATEIPLMSRLLPNNPCISFYSGVEHTWSKLTQLVLQLSVGGNINVILDCRPSSAVVQKVQSMGCSTKYTERRSGTLSSSFLVSSSMRRMSSIDSSTHWSNQQNSCLWKLVNKRVSCCGKEKGTGVWEREREGGRRRQGDGRSVR